MNAHTETPQQAARRLAAEPIRAGFEPEALHQYSDAYGDPLFWRIRLKHPNGKKWIRPMRLNGSGFVLGEPAFQDGKPLYRLPDLAARPDDPVIVVEGEGCADALAKLGLLTTTSGSADSAESADWAPMAGREIVIWPDNDEAGERYGVAVAAALAPLGCTVQVLDVAALGLPPKGDAVDWLAANPDASGDDVLMLGTVGTAQPAPDPGSAPQGESSDAATIAHLTSLAPLDYDRERNAAAEALRVRPATLDKLVKEARRGATDNVIGFAEVAPWPDPVEPAELLNGIAGAVLRFIICQPETAHAVALWAAMSWFMDVVQVAPLAVITAPEKRCGKSQLLTLLGKLCRRPLTASNISPAALFRTIDAWAPTLLVDEADAFMKENEELRGLLNAGHTRESAYVVRLVGDAHTPAKFNVWGAKALAGIGHLADTLMDRAIVLELRRKLPAETVDRLRHAEPGLFDELASKLARFSEDFSERVRSARPDLPGSLNDRAQDNWEPLLAIADVAGGPWPTLARQAALKLSGAESPTMSAGTELLADIQHVFDARKVERITTADLIAALCEDDEASWATYNRGKPLSPRQLAKRLGGYGVSSKNLKISYGDVKKGFERSQFEEAFARYLTSSHPPENARYPLQPSNGAPFEVARGNEVAATAVVPATLKPLQDKGGSGVADKPGSAGSTTVEGEL